MPVIALVPNQEQANSLKESVREVQSQEPQPLDHSVGWVRSLLPSLPSVPTLPRRILRGVKRLLPQRSRRNSTGLNREQQHDGETRADGEQKQQQSRHGDGEPGFRVPFHTVLLDASKPTDFERALQEVEHKVQHGGVDGQRLVLYGCVIPSLLQFEFAPVLSVVAFSLSEVNVCVCVCVFLVF